MCVGVLLLIHLSTLLFFLFFFLLSLSNEIDSHTLRVHVNSLTHTGRTTVTLSLTQSPAKYANSSAAGFEWKIHQNKINN